MVLEELPKLRKKKCMSHPTLRHFREHPLFLITATSPLSTASMQLGAHPTKLGLNLFEGFDKECDENDKVIHLFDAVGYFKDRFNKLSSDKACTQLLDKSEAAWRVQNVNSGVIAGVRSRIMETSGVGTSGLQEVQGDTERRRKLRTLVQEVDKDSWEIEGLRKLMVPEDGAVEYAKPAGDRKIIGGQGVSFLKAWRVNPKNEYFEKYTAAKKKLKREINEGKKTVSRIDRLPYSHRELGKRFHKKLNIDPFLNEFLGLHVGSLYGGLNGIIQGGFALRFGSPDSVLGIGNYFSDDLGKSDQYQKAFDTKLGLEERVAKSGKPPLMETTIVGAAPDNLPTAIDRETLHQILYEGDMEKEWPRTTNGDPAKRVCYFVVAQFMMGQPVAVAGDFEQFKRSKKRQMLNMQNHLDSVYYKKGQAALSGKFPNFMEYVVRRDAWAVPVYIVAYERLYESRHLLAQYRIRSPFLGTPRFPVGKKVLVLIEQGSPYMELDVDYDKYDSENRELNEIALQIRRERFVGYLYNAGSSGEKGESTRHRAARQTYNERHQSIIQRAYTREDVNYLQRVRSAPMWMGEDLSATWVVHQVGVNIEPYFGFEKVMQKLREDAHGKNVFLGWPDFVGAKVEEWKKHFGSNVGSRSTGGKYGDGLMNTMMRQPPVEVHDDKNGLFIEDMTPYQIHHKRFYHNNEAIWPAEESEEKSEAVVRRSAPWVGEIVGFDINPNTGAGEYAVLVEVPRQECLPVAVPRRGETVGAFKKRRKEHVDYYKNFIWGCEKYGGLRQRLLTHVSESALHAAHALSSWDMDDTSGFLMETDSLWEYKDYTDRLLAADPEYFTEEDGSGHEVTTSEGDDDDSVTPRDRVQGFALWLKNPGGFHERQNKGSTAATAFRAVSNVLLLCVKFPGPKPGHGVRSPETGACHFFPFSGQEAASADERPDELETKKFSEFLAKAKEELGSSVSKATFLTWLQNRVFSPDGGQLAVEMGAAVDFARLLLGRDQFLCDTPVQKTEACMDYNVWQGSAGRVNCQGSISDKQLFPSHIFYRTLKFSSTSDKIRAGFSLHNAGRLDMITDFMMATRDKLLPVMVPEVDDSIFKATSSFSKIQAFTGVTGFQACIERTESTAEQFRERAAVLIVAQDEKRNEVRDVKLRRSVTCASVWTWGYQWGRPSSTETPRVEHKRGAGCGIGQVVQVHYSDDQGHDSGITEGGACGSASACWERYAYLLEVAFRERLMAKVQRWSDDAEKTWVPLHWLSHVGDVGFPIAAPQQAYNAITGAPADVTEHQFCALLVPRISMSPSGASYMQRNELVTLPLSNHENMAPAFHHPDSHFLRLSLMHVDAFFREDVRRGGRLRALREFPHGAARNAFMLRHSFLDPPPLEQLYEEEQIEVLPASVLALKLRNDEPLLPSTRYSKRSFFNVFIPAVCDKRTAIGQLRVDGGGTFCEGRQPVEGAHPERLDWIEKLERQPELVFWPDLPLIDAEISSEEEDKPRHQSTLNEARHQEGKEPVPAPVHAEPHFFALKIPPPSAGHGRVRYSRGDLLGQFSSDRESVLTLLGLSASLSYLIDYQFATDRQVDEVLAGSVPFERLILRKSSELIYSGVPIKVEAPGKNEQQPAGLLVRHLVARRQHAFILKQTTNAVDGFLRVVFVEWFLRRIFLKHGSGNPVYGAVRKILSSSKDFGFITLGVFAQDGGRGAPPGGQKSSLFGGAEARARGVWQVDRLLKAALESHDQGLPTWLKTALVGASCDAGWYVTVSHVRNEKSGSTGVGAVDGGDHDGTTSQNAKTPTDSDKSECKEDAAPSDFAEKDSVNPNLHLRCALAQEAQLLATALAHTVSVSRLKDKVEILRNQLLPRLTNSALLSEEFKSAIAGDLAARSTKSDAKSSKAADLSEFEARLLNLAASVTRAVHAAPADFANNAAAPRPETLLCAHYGTQTGCLEKARFAAGLEMADFWDQFPTLWWEFDVPEIPTLSHGDVDEVSSHPHSRNAHTNVALRNLNPAIFIPRKQSFLPVEHVAFPGCSGQPVANLITGDNFLVTLVEKQPHEVGLIDAPGSVAAKTLGMLFETITQQVFDTPLCLLREDPDQMLKSMLPTVLNLQEESIELDRPGYVSDGSTAHQAALHALSFANFVAIYQQSLKDPLSPECRFGKCGKEHRAAVNTLLKSQGTMLAFVLGNFFLYSGAVYATKFADEEDAGLKKRGFGVYLAHVRQLLAVNAAERLTKRGLSLPHEGDDDDEDEDEDDDAEQNLNLRDYLVARLLAELDAAFVSRAAYIGNGKKLGAFLRNQFGRKTLKELADTLSSGHHDFGTKTLIANRKFQTMRKRVNMLLNLSSSSATSFTSGLLSEPVLAFAEAAVYTVGPAVFSTSGSCTRTDHVHPDFQDQRCLCPGRKVDSVAPEFRYSPLCRGASRVQSLVNSLVLSKLDTQETLPVTKIRQLAADGTQVFHQMTVYFVRVLETTGWPVLRDVELLGIQPHFSAEEEHESHQGRGGGQVTHEEGHLPQDGESGREPTWATYTSGVIPGSWTGVTAAIERRPKLGVMSEEMKRRYRKCSTGRVDQQGTESAARTTCWEDLVNALQGEKVKRAGMFLVM